MKVKVISCMLVFLLAVVCSVSAQNYRTKRVTVMPFTMSGVNSWWGNSYNPAGELQSAVTSRMQSSGHFALVSGSGNSQWMRNNTSFTRASNNAARADGRMAGADYVLTGVITEFTNLGAGNIPTPRSQEQTPDRIRIRCDLRMTNSQTGRAVTASYNRTGYGGAGLSGLQRIAGNPSDLRSIFASIANDFVLKAEQQEGSVGGNTGPGTGSGASGQYRFGTQHFRR